MQTPKKDPTDYVGNVDGTNWKGYIQNTFGGGSIQCDVNDDLSSITINHRDINHYDPYWSNNLIIPKKVSDGAHTYKVTDIGEWAFGEYSAEAWAYCKGTVVFPKTLITIGDCAFMGQGEIQGNLLGTLLRNISYIGAQAFNNCQSLTGDLIIPDGVQNIGDRTFYGCKGLNGILRLGKNIATIGKRAFAGCNGLHGSLMTPNTLISIGDYAFDTCTGFSRLLLNAQLQTISQWAFNGCSNLIGSLSFSNNITDVSNSAFSGCAGFDEIIFIGWTSQPSWTGSNIFLGWSGSKGGTVVTSNGTLSAADALTYLESKGLPDNGSWHE